AARISEILLRAPTYLTQETAAMPARPLPPSCLGPLNSAPWLRRLLLWRYVCRQPSVCCGRDPHGCPVRAMHEFDNGNGVVAIQLSKHEVANDFGGPGQGCQPD